MTQHSGASDDSGGNCSELTPSSDGCRSFGQPGRMTLVLGHSTYTHRLSPPPLRWAGGSEGLCPFMQLQVDCGCVGSILISSLFRTPFSDLLSLLAHQASTRWTSSEVRWCTCLLPFGGRKCSGSRMVFPSPDHFRCQSWLPFGAPRGQGGFFELAHVT